jgi:hypothetical protein
MMEEYKFEILIVPESYDYGEEEIVYRIYFDEQLISERSLPVLNSNQGIIDTFYVNADFIKVKKLYIFYCKEKKAKFRYIKVNDFTIKDAGSYTFKNIKLEVGEYKINIMGS